MSDERWEIVRRLGLSLAIFLAMLPVLYVLSIGPAMRWFDQKVESGTLTDEQVEYVIQFYSPIDFVYVNSPETVATAFDWYCDLWD